MQEKETKGEVISFCHWKINQTLYRCNSRMLFSSVQIRQQYNRVTFIVRKYVWWMCYQTIFLLAFQKSPESNPYEGINRSGYIWSWSVTSLSWKVWKKNKINQWITMRFCLVCQIFCCKKEISSCVTNGAVGILLHHGGFGGSSTILKQLGGYRVQHPAKPVQHMSCHMGNCCLEGVSNVKLQCCTLLPPSCVPNGC